MTSRAGDESGATLPIAVAVLLIVILLSGAAVAYSVRSVDRSNYDRNTARALAAADAGLDVASYRMNKTLLAGHVAGLFGLLNEVGGTLACTRIGLDALDGLVTVEVSGDGHEWCAAGGWEPLDGDGRVLLQQEEACERGHSAAFRYFMRLDVEASVKVSGEGMIDNDPLAWQVISAGCTNGRMAVVRGEFPVGLTGALSSGRLLQLFKLSDYAQCRGLEFNPADPAAGCP